MSTKGCDARSPLASPLLYETPRAMGDDSLTLTLSVTQFTG
ncbi:hypothetical protein [Nostoc sp.]